MLEPTQQFEQKLTPAEHLEKIGAEIRQSPERAKEIMADYSRQAPEDIYSPEHLLSPEQYAEMEKAIMDPDYQEKEKLVEKLFELAREKGALYATKAAKKFPPAVTDDFHDRLIKYLNKQKQ